jgi:hypothetical protein
MFERVDEHIRAMNRAAARVLRDLMELDVTEGWVQEGATSLSAWLRGRYGWTKATAVEWVRVARALRSLPAIAEATSRGELGFEQLRPLTRFATPRTDEELSRSAPAMSAPELWDEARRHERLRERESRDVHRARTASLWWNEARTEACMFTRMGAEQGAAMEQALVKRSQEITLADDPLDPGGARMVDALVELVASSGDHGAVPTVVIHADACVLTGEESRRGPVLCETPDGTRLHTEAVRRLACDARIEWNLERGGRAVGIGRRSRIPPAWLLRAIRYRDRGCVFPGCGRIRWLKAHHVVHWGHGGRTDLDNLVLVCHAHHRLVHEGGWSIRGRPGAGGELRFCDPRGREPFLKQGRFEAA